MPDVANAPAVSKHHHAPAADTSISMVVLLGLIVIVATVRNIDSVPAPDEPSHMSNRFIEFDDTIAPTQLAERESDEPKSGKLIDPNTAPWWELTAIPGIGEITAKRIIEHREAAAQKAAATTITTNKPHVVFKKPADLQSVHSIGPARAEAMAPYLTFPEPDASR